MLVAKGIDVGLIVDMNNPHQPYISGFNLKEHWEIVDINPETLVIKARKLSGGKVCRYQLLEVLQYARPTGKAVEA